MTPFADHFSLGITPAAVAFAECAASVDKCLDVADTRRRGSGLSTTDVLSFRDPGRHLRLLDIPSLTLNACSTGNAVGATAV